MVHIQYVVQYTGSEPHLWNHIRVHIYEYTYTSTHIRVHIYEYTACTSFVHSYTLSVLNLQYIQKSANCALSSEYSPQFIYISVRNRNVYISTHCSQLYCISLFVYTTVLSELIVYKWISLGFFLLISLCAFL